MAFNILGDDIHELYPSIPPSEAQTETSPTPNSDDAEERLVDPVELTHKLSSAAAARTMERVPTCPAVPVPPLDSAPEPAPMAPPRSQTIQPAPARRLLRPTLRRNMTCQAYTAQTASAGSRVHWIAKYPDPAASNPSVDTLSTIASTTSTSTYPFTDANRSFPDTSRRTEKTMADVMEVNEDGEDARRTGGEEEVGGRGRSRSRDLGMATPLDPPTPATGLESSLLGNMLRLKCQPVDAPTVPQSRSSSLQGRPEPRRNSTSSLTRISTFFAQSDKNGRKARKERQLARIQRSVDETLEIRAYLVTLCRAMMLYGAPNHRIEDYMAKSARKLGVDGAGFLYLPGCMIITFEDREFPTSEVRIVRVGQGLNLGRLRDVHEVYKDVVHDRLEVQHAHERLQGYIDEPNKFHVAWRILCYGLASALVAPFAFGGRLVDMPIVFLLGCIVGTLQLVAVPRSDTYSHVFEVTSACITTFLARAFGSIRGGDLFCFGSIAQSSIVLILPGYMILCASMELQSRNLVSGGVRIVYSLVYVLFLTYGMTVGASLYGLIDQNATDQIKCQNSLRSEYNFAFVSAFTLVICVIYQAKWRQMPGMLFTAMVGYTVTYFVALYIPPGNMPIVVAVGAFAVGLVANAPARLLRVYSKNTRFGRWLQAVVPARIRSVDGQNHLETQATRTADRLGELESGTATTASTPEKPSPIETVLTGSARNDYGYAAATMIPAILVLVPSGIAATGSLLAGISSANSMTRDGDTGGTSTDSFADGTMDVMFRVVQVAMGASIGLFLSVLVWYSRGKKDGKSGVFSF